MTVRIMKSWEKGLVKVLVVCWSDYFNGVSTKKVNINEEERNFIKKGGGGWPIIAVS